MHVLFMEKRFESQPKIHKYVTFLSVLFIVMSTLIQKMILLWILILSLNVMLLMVIVGFLMVYQYYIILTRVIIWY